MLRSEGPLWFLEFNRGVMAVRPAPRCAILAGGESMTRPQIPAPGVTFVIPVRNGARWLDAVLSAIRNQHWPGPTEIIAIDDRSTDSSRVMLDRHAADGAVIVLDGEGRGAAAAINLGIARGSHPFIAQVDQDVVIHPGWLATLMAAFDDAAVAAAQGRYVAPADADIWSDVMALDLEHRYRTLRPSPDHVCTGNTVYRRTALGDVRLFDERLGYGYDNDLSYRLGGAGFRLAFRPDATSTHHWRQGLAGYARQQYGFGYGRLDLLAKHRTRARGDDVSGLGMMAQAPATATVIVLAACAAGAHATGHSPALPATLAAVVALALVLERFSAGLIAARSSRSRAGFWFVPVHAVRNLAWVAAIVVWSCRRLRGARASASDSMHPRSSACVS